MNRGTHAAGDGSFGRSASSAGLRGLLLIIVAVAIGAVLLNRATPTPAGLSSVRASTPTTHPTRNHGATTTTIPAPTTSTTVKPASNIKVLVANSTSVQGQALRYTSVVKGFGYTTLSAVNATVQNLTTSRVYYASGFAADAGVLAAKLGLPKSVVQAMPAAPPVVFLNGANLLLVVGLDLANATSTSAGGQSAGTTTTVVRQAPATTAPPRTTTTVHS